MANDKTQTYVSDRLALADSRSLEKSSKPVIKLETMALLPFEASLPQFSFFNKTGMTKLSNMVRTAVSRSPSGASMVPKNTS